LTARVVQQMLSTQPCKHALQFSYRQHLAHLWLFSSGVRAERPNNIRSPSGDLHLPLPDSSDFRLSRCAALRGRMHWGKFWQSLVQSANCLAPSGRAILKRQGKPTGGATHAEHRTDGKDRCRDCGEEPAKASVLPGLDGGKLSREALQLYAAQYYRTSKRSRSTCACWPPAQKAAPRNRGGKPGGRGKSRRPHPKLWRDFAATLA